MARMAAANTPPAKAMKARDFARRSANETDEQLIEIVTNGKNKMPSYKGN